MQLPLNAVVSFRCLVVTRRRPMSSLPVMNRDCMFQVLNFLDPKSLLVYSLVSKRARTDVRDCVQYRTTHAPSVCELMLVKLVNMAQYGVEHVPGRNIIRTSRIRLLASSVPQRVSALYFLFEFDSLTHLEMQVDKHHLAILDHVVKALSQKSVHKQLTVVIRSEDASSSLFDVREQLLRIVLHSVDVVQAVRLVGFDDNELGRMLTLMNLSSGISYHQLVKSLFTVEEVRVYSRSLRSPPDCFLHQSFAGFSSATVVARTVTHEASYSHGDVDAVMRHPSPAQLNFVHVDSYDCGRGQLYDSLYLPLFLLASSCPVRQCVSKHMTSTRTGGSASLITHHFHSSLSMRGPLPSCLASSGKELFVVSKNPTHLWDVPDWSHVALAFPNYMHDHLFDASCDVDRLRGHLSSLAHRGVRLVLLSVVFDDRVVGLVGRQLAMTLESGLWFDGGVLVLVRHHERSKIFIDDVSRRAFTREVDMALTTSLGTHTTAHTSRTPSRQPVRAFFASHGRMNDQSYMFLATTTRSRTR